MPYNQCRNLEWLMCAIRGMIPGQQNGNIIFANPPSSLFPAHSKTHIGHCKGWLPTALPDKQFPRAGYYGYANDDIYYLESCFFSMLCRNRDQLFKIRYAQDFVCDLDEGKFWEIAHLLLNSPVLEPAEEQKCYPRRFRRDRRALNQTRS